MKTKKVPMRRCAGCMQSKEKKEMIRIVGDREGCVKLDVTGKAPGRGVSGQQLLPPGAKKAGDFQEPRHQSTRRSARRNF